MVRWLAVTLAAVVAPLVFTALASGAPVEGRSLEARTAAKVVFVDVGQGDGVVMKVGGTVIVSDAGEDFAADEMHRALRKIGAKKRIGVAILSHSHDDHIGGFEPLMERYGYTIERAVAARNKHWQRTQTNRSLLRELRQRDVRINWVKAGDRFRFGKARWRVLSPPGRKWRRNADAANGSVVFLLTVNRRKLLFTGDIEEEATRRLARRWRFGRVDVFLVTHHGSKSASSDALLREIRPRFAVLSVGRNSFGHPTEEVVQRLEGRRAKIWCTDVNGDVTLTIAGGGKLRWRAADQRRAWSTPNGRKGTCGAFTAGTNGGGGGGGGGGACHPSYSPCLPVKDDLNCGEIPDSKKPVTVKGSDPYRLDSDNDGLGCEG